MKKRGIAMMILPCMILLFLANICVREVSACNGVEQKARKEWEVSGSEAKYIGEEKAKQIMMEQVPGGELKEFHLDAEDEVPEYEGKIIKGKYEYEVSLNALTGEVIEIEMEKLKR